jgi:hypothetical protein
MAYIQTKKRKTVITNKFLLTKKQVPVNKKLKKNFTDLRLYGFTRKNKHKTTARNYVKKLIT